MATVTVYPNCPCCDDAQSGSGSGDGQSGSGNDGYPVLLCNGDYVSSVLYATFTGVMASLGAVRLDYDGIYTWNNLSVPGVQCFAGGAWVVALGLCVAGKGNPFGAGPGEGQFNAFTFGTSGNCSWNGSVPYIKAVDSFVPFLFTGAALLALPGGSPGTCPAPCNGASVDVIITETPP